VTGGSATPTSTLDAFKVTLHPVLTRSCGSCHGVSTAPLHAVNDAASAMNLIVNGGLVNFTSPGSSLLVTKIRLGHNGISVTVADALQAQIVAWVGAAQAMAPTPTTNPSPTPTTTPTPTVPTPTTPNPLTTLTASYQSIQKFVLGPKCVGCHGPNKADAGVRVDTYANTMKLVKAGNAAGSLLISDTANGNMPPGSNDLTSTQLNVIRTWIQNGAANN
jgi:mono/diheme cytochrome c family protein